MEHSPASGEGETPSKAASQPYWINVSRSSLFACTLSHQLPHRSARARRREYMSCSGEDLRKKCAERGLHYNVDFSREELINKLEDDDKQNETWVQSTSFEYFFLGVVVVNAVAIGFEIDYPMALPEKYFVVLNLAFVVLFAVEAAMKLVVLGVRKYAADLWNLFDVIVVFLVAFQLVLLPRAKRGDLQILRLCRLFRLARIFKELGALVQSFVMSMQALSWILVLMILWFYVAACFTTLFIGKRKFEFSEEAEEIQEVRAKFSSIPMSMFALFEIMTLEGWTGNVRPFLSSQTAHLVAFFIVFIFVSAFFMLNLVTAVVVDRTVAAQEEAKESQLRDQQFLRTVNIGLICEQLRARTEEEMPGTISREVFQKAIMEILEIKEAMQALGWNNRYMLSMFDCVDTDASGQASFAQLQKLLQTCDQPLDTANYARFQANLAHRLEHQETLLLTVLHALELATQQKLDLPAEIGQRMRSQSLLVGSSCA